MGVDAHSILAYGCHLTEEDVFSLRKRVGCKDVYTFVTEFLISFNQNNDSVIELEYTEYDSFLYVETPSHTCGGCALSVESVGSGPTFSMTVDDRNLAAIEVLKRELPEANKEWGWKLLAYYS